MFPEARHQAALDRHADLLEAAAAQQTVQNLLPSPWWRRVVWRPVQFTLRLPVLTTPRGGQGA